MINNSTAQKDSQYLNNIWSINFCNGGKEEGEERKRWSGRKISHNSF